MSKHYSHWPEKRKRMVWEDTDVGVLDDVEALTGLGTSWVLRVISCVNKPTEE